MHLRYVKKTGHILRHNFGDAIGRLILGHIIPEKTFNWSTPSRAEIFSTGSIAETILLTKSSRVANIWGSGFREYGFETSTIKRNFNIIAIRGELSAELLNIDPGNAVLGDPALLVSKYIDVKLISEHSIDVVLSDHRYGFRSSTCCSIFITHQCKLPIKGIWFPIQWLHRYFIRKFNYIWIVDDEEKRYAGELSTPLNTNSMYIGIQSRFKRQELAEEKPLKEIECILLVSGPLPFSNKLITHFTEGFCAESDPKYIIGSEHILECLPEALRPYFKSNHDWLAADKLLISSKKLMSYCGYSTLMDVQFLECETNFIATEGQLEQNYLLSRTKKASAINRGFKI
jgi:hypothetical protein